MSLRDCFRLQVVEDGCRWRLTTFGRAKLMTGEHPLSDRPQFYMAYWVRLPVIEYRLDFMRRRYCMQGAILCWHGRDGFLVLWEPVPGSFT